MMSESNCSSCIPEIDYICSEHREPNQCVGCNRTNQKLYVSAFGIICKDCLRQNGVVFV